MGRAWILATAIGLLAVSCSSGGGSASTSSISGNITVDGTPLADLAATTATTPAPGLLQKRAFDAVTAAVEEPAAIWTVHVRWADGIDGDRQARQRGLSGAPPRRAKGGAWQRYHCPAGEVPTLRRELLGRGLARQVQAAPLAGLTYTPSDGLFDERQWNMQLIGMERAWDVTRGSSSVRVAVLDAGIDPDHAEFAGRLADGYDFVTWVANADDGDGRDADPTDPVSGGLVSHGSHVAGVVGANADGSGVVGVDHQCTIMPVRCIGRLGGEYYDIWDALIYAADLSDADLAASTVFADFYPGGLDPARPRPSAPADVITMSFGGNYAYDTFGDGIQLYQDILTACATKGVVLVAAAGNEATIIDNGSRLKMPAGGARTICVAAVGPEAAIAGYSNYGSQVDIAAPGGIIGSATAVTPDDPDSGGVLSCDDGDTYVYLQGTSMAAPHVAGVCALLLAVQPGLTPDQVAYYLSDNALDIGDAGVDTDSGAGLLLADRALLAAQGGSLPTQLVLYTSQVTVAWSESTAGFTYNNLGGALADLGALSYAVSYGSGASDWLTGVAVSDGLASIGVDRSGLADGVYEATLTITSANGGAESLTVRLEVLASNPIAAIDAVYVLLIDADTDVVVEQVTVLPGAGGYTFTDVAPGFYYVAAGTDFDGDDYINDPGEYAGVYRDSDNQEIFQIETGGSLSGLDINLTLVGPYDS